jgi:phosphatidylserine decarboxylase
LIQDDELAKGYSHIGIFRLAPQDYHRFHSPVNAIVGKTKDITGNLYTVNPMAVKE